MTSLTCGDSRFGIPALFLCSPRRLLFSLAASTNPKDDDDEELLGRLRPQPVLLLHGVVGLGLAVDVEHAAHVLAGVLADLALVDHVPVDVAVRLGALRPDAAMWRHLAAEIGTLGGDDGPADGVVRHGDLVDLELVLESPADVVVGLGVLRLVAALRDAL